MAWARAATRLLPLGELAVVPAPTTPTTPPPTTSPSCSWRSFVHGCSPKTAKPDQTGDCWSVSGDWCSSSPPSSATRRPLYGRVIRPNRSTARRAGSVTAASLVMLVGTARAWPPAAWHAVPVPPGHRPGARPPPPAALARRTHARSPGRSLECGPTSGVTAGNGCETAHVKTPDRGQPSGPIGRLQLAETYDNRKASETSRTRG